MLYKTLKCVQQFFTSFMCFCFVCSDIMMIYNDPPPGMFIVPDKEDMTTVCIFCLPFYFLFAT